MLLGGTFSEIFPAIILLLAFAIIGGVVILVLRKKLKSNMPTSRTFTLVELRKLRDEGKIDECEYERARQSILDQIM